MKITEHSRAFKRFLGPPANVTTSDKRNGEKRALWIYETDVLISFAKTILLFFCSPRGPPERQNMIVLTRPVLISDRINGIWHPSPCRKRK